MSRTANSKFALPSGKELQLTGQEMRFTQGLLFCGGSILVTAAISLTFVLLEGLRVIRPGMWFIGIIYGNPALAAIGCGMGAVYVRGRHGRRLMTSLIGGAAGAAGYGLLFFIGLVGIVTLHNAFFV